MRFLLKFVAGGFTVVLFSGLIGIYNYIAYPYTPPVLHIAIRSSGAVLGTTVQLPVTKAKNGTLSAELDEAYIDRLIMLDIEQARAAGWLGGAPGPQGPPGPSGSGSGGGSAPSPIYYLPSGPNFTGGSNLSITNLASDQFFTRTADVSQGLTTQTLGVSGNTTLGGDLSVTGTITGNVAGVINPSFTLGSIPFQGASGLAEDNAGLFYDATLHALGVGTNTLVASAILQANSTTKGFLPPRMTTAQKNAIASPATGLTIYDTDLNKLNVFNGTAWKNISSPELGGEITGGTAGSVLFVNPTGLIAQDNPNFFYDAATHKLGIGTTSPNYPLEVVQTSAGTETIPLNLKNADNANGAGVALGFSDIIANTTTGKISNIRASIGNYDLVFSNFDLGHTALAEKMRLTAAGNVILVQGGLDIRGDQGSCATSSLNLGYDGTTGLVYTCNTKPFGINTAGVRRLTVDTSGNVGIGTSSPQGNLHINSTGTNSVVYLSNTTSGSGSNDGLLIQQASTDAYFWNYESGADIFATSGTERMRINGGGNISMGAVDTSSDASLEIVKNSSTDLFMLSSAAANDGDYLTVKNDGRVGIGTTSPGAKLAVVGEGTGQLLVGSSGFGGNYTGLSLNGTLSSSNYNFVSAPDDLSLYINRPTGGAIRFRENNSEQMFLDSGGNLGVGTNSVTSARLVVKGSTADSTIAALNVTDSGNASKFYVRNDGNVGIGTTSPGAPLDIGSSVNVNNFDNAFMARILNSRNDANGSSNLAFDTTNASAGTGLVFKIAGSTKWDMSADSGGILFRDVANSFAPELFLKAGGNVGIGTASPNYPLEIAKASSGAEMIGLTVKNATGGVGSDASIQLIPASTLPGTRLRAVAPGASDVDLAFYTVDNNNGGAEIVRITGNGNVGIGTTSPGSRLTVQAPSDDSNWISLQRSAASLELFNIKMTNGSNQDLSISSNNRSNIIYLDRTNDFVGINLAVRPVDAGVYGGVVSANNFSGGWGQLAVYDTSAGATGVGGALDFIGNGTAGAGQITGGRIRTLKESTGSRAFSLAFYSHLDGVGFANLNESMRILSNGNVGIGVTNPSSFKLQVAGNIGPDVASTYDLGSSSKDFANTYSRSLISSGNLQVTAGSGGGSISFAANGSGTLFQVASTGINAISGVPITLDPGGVMTLGSATGSGRTINIHGQTTVTTGVGTGVVTLSVKAASSQTADLFQWQNSSGTPLGVISVAGNVGVGTASPGRKLHVVGTAGFPVANPATDQGVLRLAAGTNSVLEFGNSDVSTNTTYPNWIQSRDVSSPATYYSLLLNPLGGNVGIGTTTPAAKFTVSGGDLQVENGQGRFKGWFSVGSGQAAELGISGGTAYLYNYNRTTSAEAGDIQIGGVSAGGLMVKQTTGNVGIGTTTVGDILTVRKDSAGAITTGLRLENLANNTANTGSAIDFYQNKNNGSQVSTKMATIENIMTVAGANPYSDIVFNMVRNGTYAEKFRLGSDGGFTSSLGLNLSAAASGVSAIETLDFGAGSGQTVVITAGNGNASLRLSPGVAGLSQVANINLSSTTGTLQADTFIIQNTSLSGSGELMRVTSVGNMTWAETVAPTMSIAARTTDAATNLLTFQGQNAYASAATNTQGGSILIKSGTSVGAALGSNVILEPSTSSSWPNDGYTEIRTSGASSGVRFKYAGQTGDSVLIPFGSTGNFYISTPSGVLVLNSTTDITALSASTNDFSNSSGVKIVSDGFSQRILTGALVPLTIKAGSGNAGAPKNNGYGAVALTLQGGDAPASTVGTTVADNGGQIFLHGGVGGLSQNGLIQGNGGDVYIYGGALNAGGSGGLAGNVILTNNGTTSLGNIGIGTTTQFGTGTGVIGIANASVDPSTNPTGGGVLYASSGALKWRGSSGTVTQIAAADYAEDMPIIGDAPTSGEVVSISDVPNPAGDGTYNKFYVQKASKAYDSSVVGVVSSFTDLASQPDTSRPIALVGRVPVKFTSENGSIEVGDPLTSSATIPGAAMKATNAGYIIGYALESAASSVDSKILVYLNKSYYVPTVATLLQSGNTNSDLAGLNMGDAAAYDKLVVTDTLYVGASLIVNGKIKAKEVETQKLCVDDVCVTRDQFKAMVEQLTQGSVAGDTTGPDPAPPEPDDVTP